MSPEKRHWWKDGDRESWLLQRERRAYEEKFPPGQDILIKLPPTDWDVEQFRLGVRNWKFLLVDNRKEHEELFLSWCMAFSLLDGRWCEPEKNWKMAVCYPASYPNYSPSVTMLNWPPMTDLRISERDNVSGHVNMGGKAYPTMCLGAQYHARDTGTSYTRWGIMWFRAKLANSKYGWGETPNYGKKGQ